MVRRPPTCPMASSVVVSFCSLPYGPRRRSSVGSCTRFFTPLLSERSTLMATSSLIAHRGARMVAREELDRIDAPPGTDTWFPIRHSHVLDTAILTLQQAGFGVHSMKHALTRDSHRYFGVLDLRSSV